MPPHADSKARAHRIRHMFAEIAPRYDLMNDLMSLGLHRLWKRALVWVADPRPGERIVDLAGGTGDVARRLAAAGSEVVVCDPSMPMMVRGQTKDGASTRWLAGVAEALPVADASIDSVTIAFGIRNVTSIEETLQEVLRVLRPGGRFLCLEFSRPQPWLRPCYDAGSKAVIPRLGAWVAGNPGAYRYLVESIRDFPTQDEVQRRFEASGFSEVFYKNLTFGIACIHVGTK